MRSMYSPIPGGPVIRSSRLVPRKLPEESTHSRTISPVPISIHRRGRSSWEHRFLFSIHSLRSRMHRRSHHIRALILLFFCLAVAWPLAHAKRIVDQGQGNHFLKKKGSMDGNLVETIYYNYGEIADWQNDATHSGVWPKGTNHSYLDGVAVIVQAEASDGQGNVFHPLEANYYEYTRVNPATTVTYGWWPLPGYDNRFSKPPAQSNEPGTWP